MGPSDYEIQASDVYLPKEYSTTYSRAAYTVQQDELPTFETSAWVARFQRDGAEKAYNAVQGVVHCSQYRTRCGFMPVACFGTTAQDRGHDTWL